MSNLDYSGWHSNYSEMFAASRRNWQELTPVRRLRARATNRQVIAVWVDLHFGDGRPPTCHLAVIKEHP